MKMLFRIPRLSIETALRTSFWQPLWPDSDCVYYSKTQVPISRREDQEQWRTPKNANRRNAVTTAAKVRRRGSCLSTAQLEALKHAFWPKSGQLFMSIRVLLKIVVCNPENKLCLDGVQSSLYSLVQVRTIEGVYNGAMHFATANARQDYCCE